MIRKHWTEASAQAFVHRIAFDFVTQVEKRMELNGMSQAELARRLNVTEGFVSQMLNNPQNLTLRTIVRFARALGLKAAIVAYDDGDRNNSSGPINSEIFESCWRMAGSPRDVWSLDMHPRSANRSTRVIPNKVLVSQTAQKNQIIKDVSRKGNMSTLARTGSPLILRDGGGAYAGS